MNTVVTCIGDVEVLSSIQCDPQWEKQSGPGDANSVTVGRNLPNAVGVAVSDVNIPCCINHDCPWNVPSASQTCNVAVRVGLENCVGSSDVDTASSVNRNTARIKETSEKRRDRAVPADFPNRPIAGICNENVSGGIHCYATGVIQVGVCCKAAITCSAWNSIARNRPDHAVWTHSSHAVVVAVRNVNVSEIIDCDTTGELSPDSVVQMQLCLSR